MSLWDDITGWLHAPFYQKQDPVNWALLIVLSATLAYLWARVLDHVLEE
jgi:hypothetical protein